MGLVGGGLGAVEVAGVDHLGDHGGFDGVGADAVDADATGCVFERGGSGESDDTVFGPVVGSAAGQPYQ